MRLLPFVVVVAAFVAACSSLPIPGNPKPCASCSSEQGIEDHSRHPKLGDVDADAGDCYLGGPDCVVKAGPPTAELASVGAAVADLVATVRTSPQTNPSIATLETLSPIAATDGFCVSATTSAVDAWASAPARITAQNGSIRFIRVCHADDTNATVDVCARLNGSSGFTCANDTGTTGKMTVVDDCVSWVLARDSLSAAPQVFVRAASGTVTTCVDVGY